MDIKGWFIFVVFQCCNWEIREYYRCMCSSVTWCLPCSCGWRNCHTARV